MQPDRSMDQIELMRAIVTASGAVIGAIIGAIVAVVAIWAKDILESRRIAQLWFEQVYISEGIDRLLGYLKLQEIQLVVLRAFREEIVVKDGAVFPNIDNLTREVPLSTFPVEALVRIEMLLRTPEYTAVISNLAEFTRFHNSLPPEKRSQATMTQKINLVRQAYASLVEIREVLLGVKIKKKSKIHAINQNDAVAKTVARFAQEAQKWNERVNERDKLISQGL
jgi:hypothetical protein